MKPKIMLTVLAATIALAACEREDPQICMDTEPLLVADHSPPVEYNPSSGLPILKAHGPSPEEATAKNGATLCIKEWGWKYARSQGPNEQLADAAMLACRAKLQAVINLPYYVFDFDPDIETAAEMQAAANREKAILADWRAKAIARVIQGRAGHCKFKA